MKQVFLTWILVILWAGLIFYLSSRPGLAVGKGFVDFATRKPAHIVVYSMLFILLVNALKSSYSTHSKKNILIVSFLLTILYGVSDEIHQSFVPLREGKISDIIFDTAGAGFAFYLLWNTKVKVPKKLTKLLPSLFPN